MNDNSHQLFKRVDNCAILTIPDDIDDDLLTAITTISCEYVGEQRLNGLVIDFSHLQALDTKTTTGIFDLARTIQAMGTPVHVTGICAGLASSLAILDFNPGDIPVHGSLDHAMQRLLRHV